VRARAWLVRAAALATVLMACATQVAAGDGTPDGDQSYDVTLHNSGQLTDSYTRGTFSFGITLTYDESVPVTVQFRNGVYIGTTYGPVTFTASGSITSANSDPSVTGFSPDNCTISASSAKAAKVNVESGRTSQPGGMGDHIIDLQGGLPLSAGSGGYLVVTGSNENCDTDTAGGITVEPYDFVHPPENGWQGGAAYSEAANWETEANLDHLPFSQSFPVDFTQNDTDGGTDHVTVSETVSITGVCSATATSASARRTSAATADRCCPPMPATLYADPNGGTFNGATPLVLHTTPVHGGCPAYTWHWQITLQPKGLSVSPTSGPTSANMLTVHATCPAAKGQKGKRLNAALHACVGDVEFSVYVSDTSGKTTDFAHARNKWCVPTGKGPDICTPQLNAKLKKDFDDQGAKARMEALVKTLRAVGGVIADALTSPGAGGRIGRLHDYYNAVENGRKLKQDRRPDTDLVNKFEQAAAADPPAASPSLLAVPGIAGARPRACVPLRAPAARRAVAGCHALREPVGILSVSESQVIADLTALRTTENRYGTAVRAGNADTSALQHAATGILLGELAPDLAAYDSAGQAVTRADRGHETFPALTRRQIGRLRTALSRVRRAGPSSLKAIGVSLPALRRLLAHDLHGYRGGGVSLGRAFGRPIAASALMPPVGWVTPGEVELVLVQLVSQGALDQATATVLTGELDAAGPSPSASGLAGFAAQARQVPGTVGGYLLAAARALVVG
jgi:hypothetical protein